MEVALAGNAPAPLQASLVFDGRTDPVWKASARSRELDLALLVPGMAASTSAPDDPAISPAAKAAGMTGAPGCSDASAWVSSKSSEWASAPLRNAAPAGV